MKRKIMKAILLSLSSFAIFATSIYSLDKNISPTKLRAEDEINITISDIHDYLSTKEEHYPISDEFVHDYQQTGGGYIAYAKQLGMTVDKSQALPNQKWHFFNSWLYRSIDDGTLSWNDSAKSRVYSKLLCPELLLWIYEACNVETSKVQAAYEVAVQGKIDGLSTTTIAKNMRSQVSWDDMKADIENYINHSSGVHHVSCTSGAGYTVSAFDVNGYTRNTKVTFTVTVIDETKQIALVDSSSASILNPSEGVYEFYMPNRDVEIEVYLKDKDASDLLYSAVDLDFPTEDQTGTSSYASSFTCSDRGYPFVITNASNYNNKWDCIKIGRKASDGVSTIINSSPIVESIEGIKIEFGAYNPTGVDSAVLKISNSANFDTYNEIDLTSSLDHTDPGEVYFAINENYQGSYKYYNIEFTTNYVLEQNGFIEINRIRFLTSTLDIAESIAVTGNLPSFSVGTEFAFDNEITAHYSISGDRVVTSNLSFTMNYEPIEIGTFIPYSSRGTNIPFEIFYTPTDDNQVSLSYRIDIVTASVSSFSLTNANDISTYYGKTINDVSSDWVFTAIWSTTYEEHPIIGETIDDVHVALYDTSSPSSEKEPLPLNYKFSKADNGKYLVAFYHDIKASGSIRVSTYRSVYEDVKDGTVIFDFSSISSGSNTPMTVDAFNSYFDSSSTLPNGENIVEWVYRNNGNQIKLGNTSQQSNIEVALEERLTIDSVIVRARQYSASHTSLNIMGNNVTLTENFQDFLFAYDSGNFGKTNIFTMNTPNKKIAYIQRITIIADGQVNVGKSSDCVAVETFITNYMHMEDYTENLGWCKDNEHHYYEDARTAFNSLTEEQRSLFMENEAYADEKDRLIAWAEANTSGFDNENKVLLAHNELAKEDKPNYIVLIGLILAFGGTITAFILVNRSKRKEQ